MKRFAAPLAVALIALSSCATGPIKQVDYKTIIGQSKLEPLELTPTTDMAKSRFTVYRDTTETYNSGRNSYSTTASRDCLFGLYLGNGVFIDEGGTLCILLDKLVKNNGNPLHKTVHSTSMPDPYGVGPKITRTITYSNGSLDVKITGQSLLDYTAKYDDKTVTDGQETVTYEEGLIRVKPNIFIPLISKERIWMKQPYGWSKKFGLFSQTEYHLTATTVSDSNKTFIIQNDGECLTYTRLKKPLITYKIYKNDSQILITRSDFEYYELLEISDTSVVAKNGEKFTVEE